MTIRQAQEKDVSRIAEILVYNNRTNFFPIFKDEGYSFGELQVISVAHEYLQDKERLQNTFVFDDGVIRGFIQLSGREIQKLYVDTFFQNMGIGAALISFAVKEKQSDFLWAAVKEKQSDFLWALEKNTGALRFYEKHGFRRTQERTLEEGTREYLVKLKR